MSHTFQENYMDNYFWYLEHSFRKKIIKRIITLVNLMFSIAITNPGTRGYVTTQYKLMEAPRDSIYAYQ